jgi:glucose-6-phosphate 1-dehydrogenase
MVIFGAAGDLTKRLVVPALYNLANDHRLSEEFRLVGVDLTEMSAEQWCAHLTDAMKDTSLTMASSISTNLHRLHGNGSPSG